MSTAVTVDAVRAAGGESVARLMDRLELRMHELATGYGDELGAHAGSTIAAGGKRLRPLLVFLAAGVPTPEREELLSAAVAVELVHAATLVHDDVLDGSALRRGRPTVVATGGRLAATSTGDLLFSRAFAELARIGSADCVRVLSRASSELAAGELMQRADAWTPVAGGAVLRSLPAEDRGPVQGGLRARRDRVRRSERRAGAVRRADRPRVPGVRRCARCDRSARADRASRAAPTCWTAR